jgi:hypothetical protein
MVSKKDEEEWEDVLQILDSQADGTLLYIDSWFLWTRYIFIVAYY